MSAAFNGTQEYARTLQRIAGALSVAQCSTVAGDLADGHPVDKVKMFTDGNLDKRFEKLQDQLELLAEDMDDLDDAIVDYVRTVPLAAYDTGASDGDRFAVWLPTSRDLTPEQRDIITVIRSRVAVEELARSNRLAHVCFQELASLSDELAGDLTTNPNLTLHLNPTRIWASFETDRLLGDDTPEPAGAVLFYAWRSEVRTSVLEPESVLMLRTLADGAPCHLENLQLRLKLMVGTDLELLVDLITECAEAGLIAFS
jgi:hypothetical protein